jgi:hypothetical protein
MAWIDPRAEKYLRRRFTRADAYRFAPPGSPEAKMPGWIDPSATRVRLKEAQEEEARAQAEAAQEEFERELLQLRWEVKKLKLEHELWLFDQKYSPSQPRVPAGNPDGGQWTSGGGESAPRAGMTEPSDEPASSLAASALSDENLDDPGLKPILIQMAGDNRPVYDKADSALLAPKGINAASSEQRLRYSLDDDGRYLGGVTVVNEDRTAVGRLIESLNRAPVAVRFTAQIQTADGFSTGTFEIRKELSPGSSITIPWREFGLMKGPGQVEVTATNAGSLYTGVIVGARRVP